MRMSVLMLWTLWLTGTALGHGNEFNMVCYFSSWAVYRTGDGEFTIADIAPTLCTHLVYAFVGITENGDVDILDELVDLPDNGGKNGFGKFVALRKLSPETKFMVSMGGWNQGSVRYSNVMANASLRSNFVKNVVNFTLCYNFDGFGMDWEYPNQRNGTKADVDNFVLLLKELRAVFDEHGLILSAAVAAAESSASLSYDIPGISKYLHYINLMTFDFHGSWDSSTGHNTPLYPAKRETTELERSLNVNASVSYWLDQGAPREKIILGTAFYGKSFTLNDPAQNVPGSPITGAGEAGEYSQESGTLFYYEICERIVNESWTSVWDEEQRVPYAYLEDQWVSYDNVKSITEKANYIKKLNLGGAMIWSIDQDDFRGICGKPGPLLKALNVALRGDGADY